MLNYQPTLTLEVGAFAAASFHLINIFECYNKICKGSIIKYIIYGRCGVENTMNIKCACGVSA